MAAYNFSGRIVHDSDPAYENMVAAAHGKSPRPLCMCRPSGLEMYVAKIGELYILKRMPDTGSNHAATCGSYEPPLELSGLGEILGAAVQTNVIDGTINLKLDFSMSKRSAGRSSSCAESQASSQIGSDGTKLTMRATLHYLWSEAGFHRWSPAMAGKRTWFIIRKFLLDAAQDKLVKGRPLTDVLYVPETFSVDKKEAISSRRIAMFNSALANAAAKKYMLVIAEIKELADARYGKKIVFKHVPDCAFMLREDISLKLKKHFAAELELWGALEDLHLILLGTFSVSQNGIPSIEEMTLMLTTAQWIPIENNNEKALVDLLVDEKRRFEKGLRYNISFEKPLACAVLSDTREPVALYVVPRSPSPGFVTSLESLQSESRVASWSWDTEKGAIPPLPAPQSTDDVLQRIS